MKDPRISVYASLELIGDLQEANTALRARRGAGKVPAHALQDLIVRLSAARSIAERGDLPPGVAGEASGDAH